MKLYATIVAAILTAAVLIFGVRGCAQVQERAAGLEKNLAAELGAKPVAERS